MRIVPAMGPGPRRGAGTVDGTIFNEQVMVLPHGSDALEKLVTRLKGKTFPIHTPHDFADALLRISGGIVKTGPPPGSGATPRETG